MYLAVSAIQVFRMLRSQPVQRGSLASSQAKMAGLVG